MEMRILRRWQEWLLSPEAFLVLPVGAVLSFAFFLGLILWPFNLFYLR